MDLEQLKKRKKELHLTYDDLARLTKLERSTITNVFCGYVKYPRIDTLNKILVAMQLPTTEDEEFGVSNYELTPDKEELLMLYEEIGSKLGSEAQKGLINYARFLVDGAKN